jgi:hypothetical protein
LKHKPTSTAVVKLSSLGFNVHEEARVNRQPEEKVKTCCEKNSETGKILAQTRIWSTIIASHLGLFSVNASNDSMCTFETKNLVNYFTHVRLRAPQELN